MPEDKSHSQRLQEKRAEKKRKEQEQTPIEKREVVMHGAALNCPLAQGLGKLVVTSNAILLQDQKWATVNDDSNMVNLQFKGTCGHSKWPAQNMTPPPCMSVIKLSPWQKLGTTLVQEQQVLVKESFINCEPAFNTAVAKTIPKVESIEIKAESDEIININGHFYNEDGTFEGKVDKKSNMGAVSDVYTCTGKQKGKDKEGKEIDIYNGVKLLKLFSNNLLHSDLLSYAGIVNGEATNKNSIDVGISLKELKFERYCFANAIYNFMKSTNKTSISQLSSNFSYAKKDKTPAYNLIVNSTEVERKSEWVKIAIFAVINAVREIKDYSNGATFWDGPDVMTGNYANDYDPMKHFRQKPLNGDEYRVQGIYDSKNLSNMFYNNAKLYYSKYDTHRAPYLKTLTSYSKAEHFDVATIDPNDKTMRLKAIDSKKDIAFNKKDTILEGIGTGVFKVIIKCLWDVRAQSACSIFYNQLNKKY